jgi:hypothetical protein
VALSELRPLHPRCRDTRLLSWGRVSHGATGCNDPPSDRRFWLRAIWDYFANTTFIDKSHRAGATACATQFRASASQSLCVEASM